MKKSSKILFALSLLLTACLVFLSADTDQSKKAYELMYQDIQALKIQVQELTSLAKKNASELQEIREQLRLLGSLIRQSQSEQASWRDELKNIPLQYQLLQSKLEEIQFQSAVLNDILQAIQNLSLPTKPEDRTSGKTNRSQPPAKSTQPPQETKPQPATVTIPAQEMYNNAYGDYLKGNYSLAIESFRLFLQYYPNTPLSDNALYWIGECYYSQGMYAEAIEAFSELLLSYPSGDKVPAAYLKKGMSLAQQGKKDEALATFKLLVSKYPMQEEARLAQQKIAELGGK